MIDTDIYEGHTEGPWRVENVSIHAKADWWSGVGDMIFFSKRHGQDANSQLVADAPLLLAEVKRLQKQVRALLHENERLEAMYHMDVHGDDTLAKLLEMKK